MDDTRITDKARIQEILNEISNLKKYNNELGNSIRGEKLENLINNLNKNLNMLNEKTEKIYDEHFINENKE